MRTARHAGLPYGSVDADYIIGQTCVDSEGHVCLAKNALRAADHLLISRYYDYTQVAFHKTVVAFEQVLQSVIRGLLERGLLDCSGTAMQTKIREGSFAHFDDQFLIERLRNALVQLQDPADSNLKLKISAVLNRVPPKLILASERIRGRDQRKDHKNLVNQIERMKRVWAERFKIPEDLWHLWNVSLAMTKIGALISVSYADEGTYEEEAAQAVRILTTDPSHQQSKSRLLIEHEFALMKQLSLFNLNAIRLYVHLQGDTESVERQRGEIEQQIHRDLPDFPF
jgi:HD superfamily phosphohydrolase